MSPKKGTKAYKTETIQLFWGINPRTHIVEQVSLSRDGVIRLGSYSHVIHPSNKNRPDAEIRLVFELTDLFSVPTFLWSDENTKRRVEELRAKAAAQKVEAHEFAASGAIKSGPVEG